MLLEHIINEIGTDETGSARDNDVHDNSSNL